MDGKLQKLYDLYKDQGIIKEASFEKFASATPEQQEKLYNLGVEQGLFQSAELSDFQSAFESQDVGFIDKAKNFFGFGEDDVKKKDQPVSTASSSDVSSSVLPSKPSTPFEIAAAKARGEYVAPTGTLQEQIQAAAKSGLNESYMGNEVPYEQTYTAKHAPEVQKQKEEAIAEKKFSSEMTSQEDFKKSMGQINKDLVNNDEENVTARLKYLFGDYGFSFKEATIGVDAITVTAPNDKTLDLSIDRFTDKGDIESSNELRSFIDANKPKIDRLTAQYDKYYKKLTTQKEVDESIKSIASETNALGAAQKKLAVDVSKIKSDEQFLNSIPEDQRGAPEYTAMVNDLYARITDADARRNQIRAKEVENKNNQAKLDIAVGKFTKAKVEEGGLGKASVNAMISGVGTVAGAAIDLLFFVASHLQEDKSWSEQSEDYQNAHDKVASQIAPMLKENVGFSGVSKEYEQAASKDFVKRNTIGAAGFIPIMAGAMAQPQLAAPLFFASGYGGAMEEMDANPAFKDVPAGERVAVATTLGFINAALMKKGVTNIFLESNAGKAFTESLVKKMGTTASAKTVQEFVDNEVESAIARGAITTASAAAHGGAVGMELKIGEDAVKYAYNAMKDERKFETPETFREWASQVAESGLDMAMGGAMLGQIHAFSSAYKENNYEGVSDATLNQLGDFKDEFYRSVYEEKLKSQVASGEISAGEAIENIRNLSKSIAALDQIPQEYTPAQKRKALVLLREKEELTRSIDGKDANLVKPQKERIDAINAQLEEISKAKAPVEEAQDAEAVAEVGLSEMGQGNAQETTAKESIANAKPEEVVKEDASIEIPHDEITALEEDLRKSEEQGTLSDNLGEKVYRNNEEGNIKIEGQQYVFESNSTIKELGNINEVGKSLLTSYGLSKFPLEGAKTEKTIEGEKPTLVTIDGEEYAFLRKRKPENGKAVIVVKEKKSGLQRVIKGDKAEKVLKDIVIQKPKSEEKLSLATEGKDAPAQKSKEELKREARADRKKEREAFEAKSLDELTEMQKSLDEEVVRFEKSLLETIEKESKKEKQLLIKSDGKEFVVSQKGGGEFAISQKNSAGKFVGIKDADARRKAIDTFKKIKESNDAGRLKQAEDLASEFKKEQNDKILSALNKMIDATTTIGKKSSRMTYESTLALPLMTANFFLKIVRASYKASKSLAEAIKDGHEYLKKEGYYNISEYELKKYVIENINKEAKVKPQSKTGESDYDKIIKSIDKDVLDKKTVDEVLSRVENSNTYKNANDTERGNITRYVKEAFGEKIKSAPSAKRILGLLKDIKKITVSELSLVKKQIKDTAKGAKDAAQAIKKVSEQLGSDLKELSSSGKISADQVGRILKKFSEVNMLNTESVSRFTDYMSKVFADAEYDNKLKEAFSTKTKLKELSKDANKNPTLTITVSDFLKIDPALVKDIDEYNRVASELRDATKGSTSKSGELNHVQTVDVKEVNSYTERAMAEQKDVITEAMREQIEESLGIDGSNLTYEQMMEIIDAMEEPEKDMSAQNQRHVRSAAVKLFDSYASIIDHILSTGKDPFSGEDLDISDSHKSILKRFIEMDISQLKLRDAVKAIDALQNFIVNKSVAKMDDVVAQYEGGGAAKKVEDKQITANRLKIYGIPLIGRVLNEWIAPLPVVMDALFGGIGRASYVEKMMGITDIVRNKAVAQKTVNRMVSEYTDRFKKTKPNGEDFNTTSNDIERGMLAFVSRAKVDNADKSFADRKSLVEQSIDHLRYGTKEQQNKADEYEKIYDKILKESKSVQDARDKADNVNTEAVDYWVDKWAQHYDELREVAESVHNTLLDKYINYTPDQYSLLGPEEGLKAELKDEPDIMGSAFLTNSNAIYKKKTGRLEEAKTEDKIAKGKYVDLSFDKNNSNLMLDALVDVRTAYNVRYLDSFLRSESFKKIMPNAEERTLLQRRMNLMVRNFRNKNHYEYTEMVKVSRALNRVASIGGGMVLSGVSQMPKQLIPVAVNSMVNGSLPAIDIIYNKAKLNFINNSGETIALRGIESQGEIKALDHLIQEAAKGSVEKTVRAVENVTNAYLKIFLQNPDVFIAKASWLGYYEKALKRQGVDIKDIDYDSHKLNKEAAQYATKMIDRQQNVSDADLKGKFFHDKHWASQVLSKTLMPFASFRINQWMRMNTDIGILTSKTSAKEDRMSAARSLAGFTAEVAVFNALGVYLSGAVHDAALSFTRSDDDSDDEKKKQKERDDKYYANLKKGKGNTLVQDALSPIPIFDPVFEYGVYKTLDFMQEAQGIEEDKRSNIFNPFSSSKTAAKSALGSIGIIGERVAKSAEIMSALATGKITEDSFGKTSTKNIRQKDKETLRYLAGLSMATLSGILPNEFNSSQNYIMKEIKKNASTKTEEELFDEETKREETKAERKEKIKAIDNAIEEVDDQDVMNELLSMRAKEVRKLRGDKIGDDAKKILKEQKKLQDAELKDLLNGYENREELKRYDTELYEDNFGNNSDYYQAHEAKMKAEDLVNKIKTKIADEENDYTKTPKRKRSHKEKNSDGSYKRGYYKRTK